MGWDVMILNSQDTSSISKVDTSSLPSFGQRQKVIDKLNELFPLLEWDNDLAYGHLENEDYFGNIGLGEDEIMSGHFWLAIYGGSDPLKLIMTLCNEFNCSAFDTVTSEYIIVDNPSEKGWQQFQNFRNIVSENVAKRDNDKSATK